LLRVEPEEPLLFAEPLLLLRARPEVPLLARRLPPAFLLRLEVLEERELRAFVCAIRPPCLGSHPSPQRGCHFALPETTYSKTERFL
jgi:hypothetical protein